MLHGGPKNTLFHRLVSGSPRSNYLEGGLHSLEASEMPNFGTAGAQHTKLHENPMVALGPSCS